MAQPKGQQTVYERYVTSPDGVKWVVGRRWLFGRPRYRGFKFGRGQERYFEPARVSQVRRQPGSSEVRHTAHKVHRSRPMVESGGRRDRRAVYRDLDDPPWIFASGHRRHHRRAAGVVRRAEWGRVVGSAVRSVGSVSASRPSARGASGGRTRGASGGSGRNSGGGGRGRGAAAAGGGLAAIGPVLVTALKWILIIAVVAAITAFAIFVALPLLLFLLQLALVGLVILWREVTGRPYIVEARETRAAPKVQVWKVVGLKQSRRAIDEVAEAIRAGFDPRPTDAEPVTLTDR